jgi:prepilin-type N-terminal cleavage/methylation domain-containing protein
MNLARRKGFTLIEILVVIVIIGILATLGIGKYAQFSRDARKSGCANNQNTIDKGVGMWESKYVNFSIKATDTNFLSCVFKGNGKKGTFGGGARFPSRFINSAKADEVYDLIQDELAFVCPETVLAFEGVEQMSTGDKSGFEDYQWFMYARNTDSSSMKPTGGRLRGTGCKFWGSIGDGQTRNQINGNTDGTYGPSGTDEDLHSGSL